MNNRLKRILVAMLAMTMALAETLSVCATETEDLENDITDLQNDLKDIDNKKKNAESEKDAAQSQLSGVKSQISSISGAMGDLGEEIDATTEELVQLLTDIDLIEQDIQDKTDQIAETQVEYDAAVEDQNNQYEAMKVRCKYMYEVGEISYLTLFLESESISDAINKADYVEQLYTYDRNMLTKYQETVEYTKQVWDQLEEEKSELETSKEELEGEQEYLEEVKAQMQSEYDNYDVMLAQAKSQAASYTAKINQQTSQIKALEKEAAAKQEEVENKKKEVEEAKKKAEQEEAQKQAQAALEAGDVEKASEIIENNESSDSSESSESSSESSSSSSGSSSSYSSSGSGTGAAIASYGLQFVGNPYVAGGTSLTDGADCSGFVQSVYKHFGYSLPRSSYAQATVGTAVSYSEAQPGDIIYYGGHVGIYIGNGQIVHASTERTGIKVGSATYRSIITIRRIVD